MLTAINMATAQNLEIISNELKEVRNCANGNFAQ
jgi:hypothetical protein